MLSPNELSNLYKIISDENQTFESIGKLLNEKFKESDQMKIAISLCILLKDNLLNLSQRMISYYILYIMKKNFNFEISPFLPIIIESIQKSNNRNEQYFLLDFLNNKITYANSTIKNYIQETTNKININQNLPFLQLICQKYQNDKSLIVNSNPKMNNFMRYVLYDRKKSDSKNIDNHNDINLEKYLKSEKELNLKYFEPNLMSFCPDGISNQKFIENEPMWIMPKLRHNFLWENGGENNKKDKKSEKNEKSEEEED